MGRVNDLRRLLRKVEKTRGQLDNDTLAQIVFASRGFPVSQATWSISCGDDGSHEFSVRSRSSKSTWWWSEYRHRCPDVLIDATQAMIGFALPGWCWKTGTCHVSDDAWVCPDWSDPEHAERLKREFGGPVHGTPWDDGFDVDRRPPGNVPLAMIEAMLMALIAIEERQVAPSPSNGSE